MRSIIGAFGFACVVFFCDLIHLHLESTHRLLERQLYWQAHVFGNVSFADGMTAQQEMEFRTHAAKTPGYEHPMHLIRSVFRGKPQSILDKDAIELGFTALRELNGLNHQMELSAEWSRLLHQAQTTGDSNWTPKGETEGP